MPANFIDDFEEFEDENGARYVVFNIARKRRNLKMNMMIAGIEIVSEAALVAYALKSNFHPASPLIISAMGIVSVIDLYRNTREYIRKMSTLERYRLRLLGFLAFGAFVYCATIVGYSAALKGNNKVFMILCLGAAATCYNFTIKAMTFLGRTVMDRSPFMKVCQLLFGPAMIGSAGYYLLNSQKHDENWVICLPMIASVIVASDITFAGYGRVESNNEPRWLLFKGLELLICGCLLLTNGCVLLFYGASNQFHPVFEAFFAAVIYNGILVIIDSLESFQGCVEMEAPVFYSICGMIGGQIVFSSACISIRCIDNPNMMPVSIVTAGTGLVLLGKSVKDLHGLVPQPVFKRYCQRVFGPVVTVYSSLFAAYLGCNVGWRFSLVMMPFITAGIYATNNGFRRRN